MPWDKKAKAIPFHGTLLSISTDGGSTWLKVAQMSDIDGPGQQVDKTDVSHNESPGKIREYLAGFGDGIDISVNLNFNPTSYADSTYIDQAAFLATLGVVHKFRVTFTDIAATKWEGPGLLQSYKVSGSGGDAMKLAVTVSPAGQWTIA